MHRLILCRYLASSTQMEKAKAEMAKVETANAETTRMNQRALAA